MSGGVAWITSSYPWADDPIGGIFFRTQARRVVERGVPVSVVAPLPWAPWPLPRLRAHWRLYADAPRSEVDGGVRIARPRYPAVLGQPSIARPDRAIAAAAWRARDEWSGALLLHGHYAIQGLAAWRLARRTGLPFAITFHGDDMNTWPAQHPDRLADLRAATREAGLVVGVSRALVDRIREVTGVDAVHLPIGIDHDRLASLRPTRDAARARLGIPMDRPVAAYIGSLQREKGLFLFVDAILALGPPWLGIVVGIGPDDGYRASDDAARGVLEYRGLQPNDAVPTFLAAADALVLPSYGEGLPTILVEAGSMGTPVIATRVGGIPDLLADGRGRLLDDLSADSVASALTEVATDPVAAGVAAARLRPYVLEHYDAARNAARLIDLYRALSPDVGSVPERTGSDEGERR